jgi:hypothetical protein
MSEEEEATVVIDFNAIKDQLEDVSLDSGEGIQVVEEIEFGMGTLDINSDIGEDDEEELDLDALLASTTAENETVKNIYFFDYQTVFFKTNFTDPESHMKVIETLASLNEALQTQEECVIVFYYNDAPKIVNQLTGQIKNLFPNARTLIIAKNLSAAKAQQHHASKYGANTYLSEPFEMDEFHKTVLSI